MKKTIAILFALLVSLTPLALADDVTVTGDVDKAISVTFNYNTVAFGSVTQGTNNKVPDPDYDTGVYNVSVDTNYAWEVSVNGTDFSDGGSNSFGVGNLTVDTNADAGSLVPATAVTGSPAVVDSYSTTGTGIMNYHGYLLDVPAYQYATSYTTTITWTYVNQ